jgi:3-deoxy-7-phosphoheptulonate synthase
VTTARTETPRPEGAARTETGVLDSRTASTVYNRRILAIRPLSSPLELRAALPLSEDAEHLVIESREAVARVLAGENDRLLLVVGPCSVHDPVAALDYARRLAGLARVHEEDLLIVMRVYFEKPRTSLGWKGLINDPRLDASFAVNDGLHTARALLLEILKLGLAVGCEFLDPIIPQYLADCVAWGSIGARTAESQVHRQLCSGLSMPIGIKNSTGGDVQAAVDAVRAAASGQVFTGVGDDGRAAIFTTRGNPDCHVVLRGSATAPNYDEATVADTLSRLSRAKMPPRVLIDASHGNSGKDHKRQRRVITDLAVRWAAGETGMVGAMVESFLVGGRQELVLGEAASLTYGQSVTDACLSWQDTVQVLDELAAAARTRRVSGSRRAHDEVNVPDPIR